jgi:hypothetical protein
MLTVKPEGKKKLGRPVLRRIIKCILQKWDGRSWTGFIWLRTET